VVFGYLEETDGRYRNNDMSRLLFNQEPLHGWALLLNDRLHDLAWPMLTECCRTGKPGSVLASGQTVFEWYAEHPKEYRIFNDTIARGAKDYIVPLVKMVDWAPFDSIMDVGGGHGGLLHYVIDVHPNARYAIAELPPVCASARQTAIGQLKEKCEWIETDFFKSVPAGYSLYILKHVLHNYLDQEAVALLRNVRLAMGERASSLVCIEYIVPPPSVTERSQRLALGDLNMMTIPGGVERSEPEWRRLAVQAGFDVKRCECGAALNGIIELCPKTSNDQASSP